MKYIAGKTECTRTYILVVWAQGVKSNVKAIVLQIKFGLPVFPNINKIHISAYPLGGLHVLINSTKNILIIKHVFSY